jgi:hypothetical protein
LHLSGRRLHYCIANRPSSLVRILSADSVEWEIFAGRSTPAKFLGTVEATNADAAVAEAARLFDVQETRKLEHFPKRMNRAGFPCGHESDSRIVLEGRPV